MTPSFSLPANPREDDENRSSLMCGQEPWDEDEYNDIEREEEFEDDMYHVAKDLFLEINLLRTLDDPLCGTYNERWAT